MRTSHLLSNQKELERAVHPDSFMLSNKKGDYLWVKDFPESRYEGWFVRFSDNLYRVIESIIPQDRGELLEVRNGFKYVEKKWEKIDETFSLSENYSTLFYETNGKRKIDVFFDMRTSYSGEGCAGYHYYEQEGIVVVKFKNNICLAIKCEKADNVQNIVTRHYRYDESRNSPPFHREVMHGVTLYGNKFIFTVAKTEEKARQELNRRNTKEFLKKKKEGVNIVSAENALQGLMSYHDRGIYAGFPWFFHFWQRDEAISLKSVLQIDREVGKDVFLRLLRTGFQKGPCGVINSDAIGWLFKRAEDVMPHLTVEKKEFTKRYLKKYIEELLWKSTEHSFAVNKPFETWMDSLERDGARIELQAMRLNMYRLAFKLSTRKDEKKFYKSLEIELKEKTKKAFLSRNVLCDGYYPKAKTADKTVRPNIFIAYYIYPELLTKKEWESVFDKSLKELWLEWGGLATISKNNESFHRYHTGEKSDSYHQGDSWFYINNLAALCLHRVNKKKYQDYINKIISASEEEMMWGGAVGCHAEVSSAEKLTSDGCVNQAWSSALYLEAKKEIGSKN